jgi:hypothetical protein
VSDILSVTGRDVPAMPGGRDHRGRWEWLHWVWPVVALIGGLRERDAPVIAFWVVVLVMMVLGCLIPKRTPPRKQAPITLALIIGFSAAIVWMLLGSTDPRIRWGSVMLAAVFVGGSLIWRVSRLEPS